MEVVELAMTRSWVVSPQYWALPLVGEKALSTVVKERKPMSQWKRWVANPQHALSPDGVSPWLLKLGLVVQQRKMA